MDMQIQVMKACYNQQLQLATFNAEHQWQPCLDLTQYRCCNRYNSEECLEAYGHGDSGPGAGCKGATSASSAVSMHVSNGIRAIQADVFPVCTHLPDRFFIICGHLWFWGRTIREVLLELPICL